MARLTLIDAIKFAHTVDIVYHTKSRTVIMFPSYKNNFVFVITCA